MLIKKNIVISISITLSVLFSSLSIITQKPFYNILFQKIYLLKLIGDDYVKDTTINSVKGFKISAFITFGEYKEYLSSLKKDSSMLYYQSQLPDTTFCDKNLYHQYITNKIYEKEPAIGISWDNAFNYCRWKTLKDNKKDSIKFIYRLPFCSEWLAAKYYLEKKKIKHDFDDKYADWTMSSYDESAYDFGQDAPLYFSYDYLYFHTKKDPKVLTRKRVLGSNYYFQLPNNRCHPRGYYSANGYKFIAFRLVIDSISLSKNNQFSNQILKFWALK